MPEKASSPIQVVSTLIPLDGFNVLIPNACIDEVFIATQIEPIKQSPDWCLGSCTYKSSRILVISLEKIDQPENHYLSDKMLVIKIKKPARYSAIADFGILAQGIPHTIQANNYSLELEYSPTSSHSLAMSYIRIKDKQAFIPDLNKLITQYVAKC